MALSRKQMDAAHRQYLSAMKRGDLRAQLRATLKMADGELRFTPHDKWTSDVMFSLCSLLGIVKSAHLEKDDVSVFVLRRMPRSTLKAG